MLTGTQLLAPYGLAPTDKLVVAVSGGVDSMVLLTLLAACEQPVIAAHFNHQLRSESPAEAQMVRDYAASLKVPFVQGQWPQTMHPHSGIEAAARSARYRFLLVTAAKAGAQYLVVAHHADDQLETILLQLARSGNVMKMAGMPAVRSMQGVSVLRPLLGVAKADLYAYAKAQDVPYAEDATNASVVLRRNRIRHRVVPELKQVNPAILAHTERFSAALRGVLALAEPQLAKLAAACVTDHHADWAPCLDQPPEVQRLVLERVLQDWQVRAAPESVTQVLVALIAGVGNKTFAVHGHQLMVSYHGLQLDPVAPKPLAPLTLTCDDTWHQLDATRQAGLFHQVPQAASGWAFVPVTTLTLRTRLPGDEVCFPDGRRRALRRLLIDHKVPQTQRAQTLVAATPDACVWVAGDAWVELFQRQQTDIIQPVLAFRTTVDDSEDNNGK
ncbi:tRNA lysidine(34) synthetase TilS [Lacticaseibacillus sp. GG6-2]